MTNSAPTDLDAWAEAYRLRSCVGKNVYSSFQTAASVARRARARGDLTVAPYLCHVDHPGRWHVGHAPSMETIERLAEWLRSRGEVGSGHPKEDR